MKQLTILAIFLLLTQCALTQNVGIGEPNPTVKLTVKGSTTLPSFLVKNGDDDSLLYTSYRNLFFGGYHLSGTGVVNVSNKNFLPFDPPVVNLIAAGERSAGSANGSIANIRFSNVNTNKYFDLSSYAGGEIANQYFGIGYRDPDAAAQFHYLMYMKPTGATGFGTFTPTGRMQINHRASTVTPTLNLVDSASTGPIIELGTTGASDFWQIRANITQSSPTATYLEFGTQTAPRMYLRGDGYLGLGVYPGEKLDVNGNARIDGEVNRPSTGAANLVPVCYGNISSTGGTNNGSGNFSVSHTSAGTYEITIVDENFIVSLYTTVITPVNGSVPIIGTLTSSSGLLRVVMFNTAGTRVDNAFNFVVYKQ